MDGRRCPRVSTTILAMAAAFACAACSAGPLNAPTTATYDATFAFAFTSSDTTVSQNPSLTVTGSMILTFKGTGGTLHGNYGYAKFPAGAGTIGGTLSPSGAIAITQFGDPGSALGATMQFLQNNWPNCDFTQAQPAPFTGSLAGNDISVTGGLTVPCTYTINQQQVTLQSRMVEVMNASPASAFGSGGL
jgi:hypothetical protein